MTSREILNDLLRDIAARQGTNLGELDQNGRLSFLYRGDVNVGLECPEDGDTFAFLSADLGAVRLFRREGLFRSLLVANFLGRETGGACFGIDETKKTLALWFRFEVNGLHSQELETILNNFLQITDRWDERLLPGALPEETGTTEPSEEVPGIWV
jgi:Tir chaperone protein (CesT) family